MRRLILTTLVLFTAPVALADDESAALAGVQALLTEMSEAVESEDVGAYLSRVAPGDITFLTEQRNWAADLRDHPVHEFEIRLTDPTGLEVSEHGWAVGEVEMRWRMRENTSRRRVKFDARFTPAGDPGGPWFYAGEHWVVVADQRDGVATRAMAPRGLEAIALQIVEVLPEVRRTVDEMFGVENDHEQQVKVYGSMEHLQASIYLSYDEALGGWNEPGESIKLLAGPSLEARNLRRLLAHEYGHVATFALGPEAERAPWWVLEGVAELAGERVAGASRWGDRVVGGWKASGELREWARLADFRGEGMDHQPWVYHQGRHMLAYITDRFGEHGRNEWLTLMAAGEPLERATRLAFDASFEDLDQAWRDSIDVADDAAGASDPSERGPTEPASD